MMENSDSFEECLHSLKSEGSIKLEEDVKELLEDFSSQGLHPVKVERAVKMEEREERPEKEVKLEDPLSQDLSHTKMEEELYLVAAVGETEYGESLDSEVKPNEAVDPLAYPGDCYFSCQHCGFSTPAALVLNEHILNRREYQCPISCYQCTFSCNDLPTLTVNLQSWHGEERPSSSLHWSSSRSHSSDWINLSIQAPHSTEHPPSCSECEHICANSSNMKRYIKTCHSTNRPHSCPLFEFTSVDSPNLKRHIQGRHSTDRPHSCPHCEYASADRSNLRRHIRTRHVTDRPHSCPDCEYTCVQSATLKRHIQISHPTYRPLSCPDCNYTSADTSNVKRHIVACHSTDGPHLCPH